MTHPDELFEDYLRRLQSGEAVDFEDFCRGHPEAEEELRAHKRRLDEFGGLLGAGFGSKLAPGFVIAGKYELVRLLGKGGFGQVWLARQRPSEQLVALKLVHYDELDLEYAEDIRRRFFNEALAMGRAKHPGIVAMHDSGREGDMGWIALEYMEGGDLQGQLSAAREWQDRNELPADYDRTVASLVAKVCSALEFVHEAGIIHRDLKPQNILLDRDDEPKVADFGLARIEDLQSSRSGALVGTYYYMSPEQVMNSRLGALDHRTDVFSLGVVLYEMLSFAKPFRGDTTHQIAQQIIGVDPPDPRGLRSRAPRELCLIAAKAMEKDRERRYQSMGEFGADLRRFLAHEPIHAKAPLPHQRLAKWCRRHPVAASVGTLVSASLLVISTLAVRLHFAEQGLQESLALSESQRLSIASDRAVARVQTLTEETRMLGGSSSDGIPALQRWVDEASKLVEGDAEQGGEGLALLARRLDELRSQADRLVAVDPAASQELDDALYWRGLLEGQPAWLRRLGGLDPWPDAAAAYAELKVEEGWTSAEALEPEVVLALVEDVEYLGPFTSEPQDFAGGSYTLEKFRKGRELALLEAVQRVLDARAELAPEPLPDALLVRARWWLLVACGRFNAAERESASDLQALQEEPQHLGWAEQLPALERERAAVLDAARRHRRVAQAPLEALASAERDLELLLLEIRVRGQAAEFDDPAQQRLHDKITAAVLALARFSNSALGEPNGRGTDIEGKASIAERLQRAEDVRRVLAAPDAKAAWDEALRSVRADPRYQAARWPAGAFGVQSDLHPLGADPDSGWQEFAHLPSGALPARGPDGRLRPRPEDAIVLVLLPGGTVEHLVDVETGRTLVFGDKKHAQAPSTQFEARKFEVAPYFLGKHELTKAQWNRIADSLTIKDLPRIGRGAGLLPADGVPWRVGARVLESSSLALPSVAEWDMAAFALAANAAPSDRKVEQFPFDARPAGKDLARACNYADLSYRDKVIDTGLDATWDDGHPWMAPIAELAPSPWGLHEMHGNLWEWTCTEATLEGLGAHLVVKGGSYATSPLQARWGDGNYVLPSTLDQTMGIRAARAVR